MEVAGKSVIEKVEICLQRIRQLKQLNAFVTVTGTSALEEALNCDKRAKSGKKLPLDGVVLAVKDNFCTKDIKTTCSSHMLEDFHPTYTATIIKRLQKSGAVLIGKTNLDEFAMGSGGIDSIYGAVRNPWGYVSDAEWRVAGGSSAGSAVAVATGMCDLAIGSDTGGSTRVPSANCGVFGLKPSYGLLSRHGLIPLVNSMDVAGLISRDPNLLLQALSIAGGRDEMDSTSVEMKLDLNTRPSLKGLRIGIPKEYHAPGLCPEILQQWSRAAEVLEDNGCEITSVSLPHTQYSISCYSVLCTAEVASNMARYDGLQYGCRATEHEESTEELYSKTRARGFNHVVRGRILVGNYFLLREQRNEYIERAERIRRLIAQDFRSAFTSCDILLAPVVPQPAEDIKQFASLDNRTQTSKQDVYTQPANLAGIPAISLPAGISRDGLPLGLQLISSRGNDGLIVSVGGWLSEQLCGSNMSSLLRAQMDLSENISSC